MITIEEWNKMENVELKNVQNVILKFLKENRNYAYKSKKICEYCNLAQSSVHSALQRLKNKGLVNVKKIDHKTAYWIFGEKKKNEN